MKKRSSLIVIIAFIIIAAAIVAVVLVRTRPYPISEEYAGIRVGAIYNGQAGTESAYAHSHEMAVRETARELGLSDEQVITVDNVAETDEQGTRAAVEYLLESKCNIIIVTSDGYTKVCEDYVDDHPETIFAVAFGSKSNGKNLVSYNGRLYEARYLSGIVAGMNTKTDRIGFVAAFGKDNAQVTAGLDAFAMGVESVNPDAKIEVCVTSNWKDSAEENYATQYLIGRGCDIIAQHADTYAPQEAAAQAGVAGIGYGTDMASVSPNSVLTSVVWNWETYYTRLIREYKDGTFNGDDYYEGLSEGFTSLTPLHGGCVPGTKEAVEKAASDIEEGRLVIYSGKIPTNEGTFVGHDGETFSDDEIKYGIDWYYRNITLMEY